LLFFISGGRSATFTFRNNCRQTVWPATLSNPTALPLSNTGFQLAPSASLSITVPVKWAGRMWVRTLCSTDASGKFSCATGDCATGQVSCLGSGGIPPVTLIEFTLQGYQGKDFYDISCVDGFNIPLSVAPQGGAMGYCNAIACSADINALCPPELQEKAEDGSVVGCKSACLAFNTDQYCCRGAYGGPGTCKSTHYSQIFKEACPHAYSYAYDDASSTFTCAEAEYLITFCP
uniref:Thaumatin-like protein 1 n=1 Tax=Elaeis guineensis var. tenera TaxID=51953 RepID=A0A6I9QFV8_ELAGV